MAAGTTQNFVGGTGSIPHAAGVAFRVWAPHANAVFATGSFKGWSIDAHPMTLEENGDWFTDISAVEVGSEYRFLLKNGEKQLWRIDPYARRGTSSVVVRVPQSACVFCKPPASST